MIKYVRPESANDILAMECALEANRAEHEALNAEYTAGHQRMGKLLAEVEELKSLLKSQGTQLYHLGTVIFQMDSDVETFKFNTGRK